MPLHLSDAELDALEGLPDTALRLYLFGLRRYMNYQTGIVGGANNRMSLTVLARRCYIEPRPGRTDSGAPSIKAVRHALKILDQNGLIKQLMDNNFSVFELLMAKTDQKIRGMNGARMGQGQLGMQERDNHAASEPIRGKGNAAPHNANGARYPVSGIPEYNPLTLESDCRARASARESEDDEIFDQPKNRVNGHGHANRKHPRKQSAIEIQNAAVARGLARIERERAENSIEDLAEDDGDLPGQVDSEAWPSRR